MFRLNLAVLAVLLMCTPKFSVYASPKSIDDNEYTIFAEHLTQLIEIKDGMTIYDATDAIIETANSIIPAFNHLQEKSESDGGGEMRLTNVHIDSIRLVKIPHRRRNLRSGREITPADLEVVGEMDPVTRKLDQYAAPRRGSLSYAQLAVLTFGYCKNCPQAGLGNGVSGRRRLVSESGPSLEDLQKEQSLEISKSDSKDIVGLSNLWSEPLPPATKAKLAVANATADKLYAQEVAEACEAEWKNLLQSTSDQAKLDAFKEELKSSQDRVTEAEVAFQHAVELAREFEDSVDQDLLEAEKATEAKNHEVVQNIEF